jgi:hypothetical protein
LGVTARLRNEWRFPPGGNAYRVTVGCDFDVLDTDKVHEARWKIEAAMTPPTADQAEGWLVMLQAATAHRADSDVTSAVAYSLYAAELRQWPADVAKAACMKLARGKPGGGTNWFPTLAELVCECERAAAPRKIMLAAIKHWAPPPPPREPTPRGIPEPSEEEKAAVHRMAEDALSKLKGSIDARRPSQVDLPSIAGKPDVGGITKEMRELIARRDA